jgi:trimeric autotransporter adhesin
VLDNNPSITDDGLAVLGTLLSPRTIPHSVLENAPAALTLSTWGYCKLQRGFITADVTADVVGGTVTSETVAPAATVNSSADASAAAAAAAAAAAVPLTAHSLAAAAAAAAAEQSEHAAAEHRRLMAAAAVRSSSSSSKPAAVAVKAGVKTTANSSSGKKLKRKSTGARKKRTGSTSVKHTAGDYYRVNTAAIPIGGVSGNGAVGNGSYPFEGAFSAIHSDITVEVLSGGDDEALTRQVQQLEDVKLQPFEEPRSTAETDLGREVQRLQQQIDQLELTIRQSRFATTAAAVAITAGTGDDNGHYYGDAVDAGADSNNQCDSAAAAVPAAAVEAAVAAAVAVEDNDTNTAAAVAADNDDDVDDAASTASDAAAIASLVNAGVAARLTNLWGLQ